MSNITETRPSEPLAVVADRGPTAIDVFRAAIIRHRFVLIILTLLLLGIAVMQIPISHELIYRYKGYSQKPGSAPTGTFIAVRDKFQQLAQGLMAISIILIAIFGGSVLLTQDFESGAVRFAWTQAAGRRRTLLATVLAFSLTIGVFGSLAALTYAHGQNMLQTIGRVGPWEVRDMLFTLPDYPILLLVSFALGLFVGAVLRRTIRSIAVTLIAMMVFAYGLSAWLFQKSVSWFAVVFKTNDPLLQKVATVRAMGFADFNAIYRSGGTLINWGCTTLAGKTTFYDNPSASFIAKHHLSCFVTYQSPTGVLPHQLVWVGILAVVFLLLIWATFRTVGGRDSLWFRKSHLVSS